MNLIELDPCDLFEVEDCDEALFELDEAIAKIETQLAHPGHLALREGWSYNANLSLAKYKVKRDAVNRRRESLVNLLPEFFDALEERFGVDEVQQVWKEISSCNSYPLS
jgi:hypothetical protein